MKKEKICGIYTITNKINNKIYVGSSNNIETRFYEHKRTLYKNEHCNKLLQRSFNKYGKNNFIFEVLEEYPEECCSNLELYWINVLDTKNRTKGYNINTPIKSFRLGIKHSIESINKIKSNRRNYKGDNNPNFGKKITEKSKLKNRLSQKSRKEICQYDLNDNLIATFNSIIEAAKFLGNKNKSAAISNCCNNKTKTSHNFKWTFKNKNNE